jgi:hypothetical protein
MASTEGFMESAEKQPIALVVLVQADRAAIDQLHSFRQLDTMLETKFGTAPQKDCAGHV